MSRDLGVFIFLERSQIIIININNNNSMTSIPFRLRAASTHLPHLAGHWLKQSQGSAPLGGNKRLFQIGGLALAGIAAQHYLGNADDFFEYKFKTTKKPEDLCDFYGTEAFMDLFCVFPFMAQFMMRGGEFDEEGNIHTWGLTGPGALEVSIQFDEREEDTTGDGQPDTIAWFNKRERFHDVSLFFGGFTLWEMTQNFGYNRLDDGTCEVYHHGEHFHGFFPVRLLFQLHASYVFWATKRFINSDEFGTEDLEDEAEVIRQNIPLHVFTEFLNGLTREVEQAREERQAQSKSTSDLDETIQQLKDLSSTTSQPNSTLPHFRTLRRRNTTLTQIQLVVDDANTEDTIRSAMEQVSSTKGRRDGPVRSLSRLQRHATIASRTTKEGSKQE
jgi:hypothetical protein